MTSPCPHSNQKPALSAHEQSPSAWRRSDGDRNTESLTSCLSWMVSTSLVKNLLKYPLRGRPLASHPARAPFVARDGARHPRSDWLRPSEIRRRHTTLLTCHKAYLSASCVSGTWESAQACELGTATRRERGVPSRKAATRASYFWRLPSSELMDPRPIPWSTERRVQPRPRNRESQQKQAARRRSAIRAKRIARNLSPDRLHQEIRIRLPNARRVTNDGIEGRKNVLPGATAHPARGNSRLRGAAAAHPPTS